MAKEKSGERELIATNRRARHDYEILDRFEAGLVLFGPEVKSLRAGNANLTDGYAQIRRGEAFLHSVHIAPYEQASRDNPASRRTRKLLLHRAEIAKLEGRIRERGLTLVPLELYFKDGRAKVQLGVARGRRQYDRREAIKKRETDRELARTLRRHSSR